MDISCDTSGLESGLVLTHIAVDGNGLSFRILASDCVQLRPTCSFVGDELLRVLWPMCYSGLAVLLCVLFSDGMWAPALTASIWTSGTLLPRCSSPKPKVLLPAGTHCSNFFYNASCVAMQALEH